MAAIALLKGGFLVHDVKEVTHQTPVQAQVKSLWFQQELSSSLRKITQAIIIMTFSEMSSTARLLRDILYTLLSCVTSKADFKLS
jgi:hypothetical protein